MDIGSLKSLLRFDLLSSESDDESEVEEDFLPRPRHRFDRSPSGGRPEFVGSVSTDDNEESVDGENNIKPPIRDSSKRNNSCENGNPREKIPEDVATEMEVTVETVVKLSRLWRESQEFSPFTRKLMGELPVGLIPESYCKLVFSLGVDGTDAVMTVCAMKRAASEEFYRKRPFKDCAVSMKFIGENELTESIFKAIHMGKKGYCVHFDHRYDDHLATITNQNFHDTKSLLSLVQREANGNQDIEYINMKTEVKLRFKANSGIKFSKEGIASGLRVSPKRKMLPQRGGDWLKRLRLDDTYADVQFKVGPGLLSVFSAHQCVLAVQSSVFKAKFEAAKEKTMEICLPHISALTMESLLSLVYHSNQASFNVAMEDPNLVLEVLKLATEYKLQQVMDTCVRSLVQISCSGFTFPLALQLYLLGHQLQLSDLEFKATQIICEQKDALNTTEGATAMQNFCKNHSQTMPTFILGLLAIP